MANKLQTALATLQAVSGIEFPDTVNSLTVRNALNRAYGNAAFQTQLVNRAVESAVAENGNAVPASKRELLALLNASTCSSAIERLFIAMGTQEVDDLLKFAKLLAGRDEITGPVDHEALKPSETYGPNEHQRKVAEIAAAAPVAVAPEPAELSLDEIVSRRAGAVASASAHEAEVRTHRRIDAVNESVISLASNLEQTIANLKAELVANAEKLANSKPALDVKGVEQIIADSLARLAPERVTSAVQAAVDLPKVPTVDSSLLENSTFDQICDGLESGDFLLVFGAAGTGKSYPVEQACAKLGRRFVSLSCNRSLSASVLLSNCRLKDGTTIDRDGVLIFCMRHGLTLLLDEFDNVETADAEVLNRVSEYWSITVPETGEVVDAHPEFRLVLTANNVGDSTGTYDKAGVPPTLIRRARLVRSCNMTTAQEIDVVCRTGLDRAKAADLVKWFAAIRPHHYGTNGIHATLRVAPSLAVAVKAARFIVGGERRPGIKPKSKMTVADAIWAAYAAELVEDGMNTLKSTQQWFPEWNKYIA
jgi:hypothetical protein